MPSKIRTQSKKKRENLGQYAGQWVVFVKGKIVAHAKTLDGIMIGVKKQGLEEKAAVFLVPRKDEGPYVLILHT